jgi:hypothetical protein
VLSEDGTAWVPTGAVAGTESESREGNPEGERSGRSPVRAAMNPVAIAVIVTAP